MRLLWQHGTMWDVGEQALMIQSKQLSVLLGVAVAIWAILLMISGVTLSLPLLRPFSTVTGAVAFLLVVFDRWLWRVQVLHPWFVNVPNIRGVWKGMLFSNWLNPETGETIEPIECFMVIRQTYTTLSMRLLTKESASKVLAAQIVCEPDGIYSVFAVYTNEPKHSVRDRSPIHFGGLTLHVQGTPPNMLDGHYWTDRATQGQLCLTECRTAFPQDSTSAAELFKQKL